MNSVIYIVLFFIILLLLVQFVFLLFKIPLVQSKKKKKQCSDKYGKEIVELAEKVMCAVNTGKVKKQLLPNDSQLYNSNNTLKKYVDFVNRSAIYKKIVSIEDDKFYG